MATFPTTNQSPYGPALKAYIDEQVSIAVAAAAAAQQEADTKADAQHGHTMGQITGLEEALETLETAGVEILRVPLVNGDYAEELDAAPNASLIIGTDEGDLFFKDENGTNQKIATFGDLEPVFEYYQLKLPTPVDGKILGVTGGQYALVDPATGGGESYLDHGGPRAGAIFLDPAVNWHVLEVEAGGELEVTINAPAAEFATTVLSVRSGLAGIVWNGPTVEGTITGDSGRFLCVYERGSWKVLAPAAAAGGEDPDPEPVDDPPTRPGVVTVTPTKTGYVLSDYASTVAAGYEGSLDGGTFTDYGASIPKTITGLQPASSHYGSIRAYNSLGERSQPRAWGPAETASVTLDELLDALNAPVYLRFSNGYLEDLGVSDTPKTDWNGVGKQSSAITVQPNFQGAPVLEGDDFSVEFLLNSGLYTKTIPAELDNRSSITVMTFSKAPNSRILVTGLGSGGGGSHGTFNEASSPDSVHSWAHTWEEGVGWKQYRDGVKIDTDGFGWVNGVADRNGWDGGIWINANQYGNVSPGGQLLSRVLVVPSDNGPLGADELAAIAKAAGTFGSPR